ncbi:L-gulono-1,4-lactone dehydrogenase-like [Amphiura filiformis]|uniref:L-gulono-1,4-lactone dehydrogenase-like n=1 Tax=Amphiura filiformis TaxID=82378 RepID=UPI003B20F531
MNYIGSFFKDIYQKMAGSCDIVDCCFGLRPCHQCIFPCIKKCGYANRTVFYNYDGTESVEPLVDYFKPTNSLATKNLVRGMSLDKAVLKKGLTAVEQIAAVINFAHENELRVRAVGTGSSWSKLTNVRDILMDMTNLDQILKAEPQNEDGSIYHIEVQAGMKLHDLVREIDVKYGMSLPCMGNYAGQTIAGIISTSTHGTGQDYPTMSNFVVEIHMVIARGIQIKVRAAADGEEDEDFESVERRINAAKYGDAPLEIHSTDVFRAVAVGFGSLGAIYSVTLECVPVYNIEETRHYIEMDWPSDKQTGHFETPSELKELASGAGRYFSFFVNPFPRKSWQDADRTVLRSVYFSGERTDETGSCQCDCCMAFQCCVCTGCRGQSACQIVQTDCAATCLQIVANCLPSFIPSFADCGLHQFARDAPYIQKWYNVLTFTNGNLHLKTAEYCIPVEDMDNALKDIVRIMQDYGKLYRAYTLLPIYVRMVKADDLYLSPANRRRPDGKEVDRFCYIEVSFLPGAYGVDEFHRKVEDYMFKHYMARPHWAKNHFLNFNRVDKLYPDLHKWKRVYLLFNSDGTFDNEFTRKVGFEDLRDCECSSEKQQRINCSHRETDQVSETVTQQPSRVNAAHAQDYQNELHTECLHNHHCTSNVSTVDAEVISSQPMKSAGDFLPSLTAENSSPRPANCRQHCLHHVNRTDG